MRLKLIDMERLIHSFKTALACCIGLFIGRFINPTIGGQWIVITIIVIMCAQIYVGSVLTRALLRWLGTLLGCLIAVIALTLFGNKPETLLASLALGSFVFSYFSLGTENYAYAGTLGAATLAIILLTPHTDVGIAFERVFEISLGILISALVSQFILPIHARTHLKRIQAKTLIDMQDYYRKAIIFQQYTEQSMSDDKDESIVKLLLKQRQLAKDSIREPLGETFDAKLFMRVLYLEREILRAINFMHIALNNIKKPIFLSQSEVFTDFNLKIINCFETIIHVLQKEFLAKPGFILPNIESLKQKINTDRLNSSLEESVYLEGLLFSAIILVQCLDELAQIPLLRNSLVLAK